ncbi:hypothetical protein CEXT_731191 [Caerostris extrusa]|uniref:Uncharacterized protein n=1 Tax=Caerostris extrusa TaxID=172846 RepID=A0AAV4VXE1_CAEEX|nr:hypothetical protein CEXT_731191 [Caerostris extrusa]
MNPNSFTSKKKDPVAKTAGTQAFFYHPPYQSEVTASFHSNCYCNEASTHSADTTAENCYPPRLPVHRTYAAALRVQKLVSPGSWAGWRGNRKVGNTLHRIHRPSCSRTGEEVDEVVAVGVGVGVEESQFMYVWFDVQHLVLFPGVSVRLH